jgi:hypothetical protein
MVNYFGKEPRDLKNKIQRVFLFYDLLSLKTGVNVFTGSNKQKNLEKNLFLLSSH